MKLNQILWKKKMEWKAQQKGVEEDLKTPPRRRGVRKIVNQLKLC